MQKVFFSIGKGLDRHNPRLCLVCKRPIRASQSWLVASSGGLRIIRHTACVASGSLKKWGLLK